MAVGFHFRVYKNHVGRLLAKSYQIKRNLWFFLNGRTLGLFFVKNCFKNWSYQKFQKRKLFPKSKLFKKIVFRNLYEILTQQIVLKNHNSGNFVAPLFQKTSILGKNLPNFVYATRILYNFSHVFLTAIPYRASTGPEQGFPCEVFLTGKNLFSLHPCNDNRVPCNENRFFSVRKTSQGKPCSGPVLALYWPCTGLQWREVLLEKKVGNRRN